MYRFMFLVAMLSCGMEEKRPSMPIPTPKKPEKPLEPVKPVPPKKPEPVNQPGLLPEEEAKLLPKWPDRPDFPERPDFPREPDKEPEQTCVSPIADVTVNGRYRIVRKQVGLITVYEPVVRGCKMPVYSHSNGTGARSIFYRTQLERFASHGYLAVSYETTQSGSGLQQMRAVDYALRRSDTANLLAAAGHSQGGSSAAIVHYLAQRKYRDRLKIVSIMEQPAWGMNRPTWRREVQQLQGASFVINGTADTLVSRSWVASGERLLRNDHAWYQANGATHFNVQPWAAAGGLAFANCKLLNYERGCREFNYNMPRSRWWTTIRR